MTGINPTEILMVTCSYQHHYEIWSFRLLQKTMFVLVQFFPQ